MRARDFYRATASSSVSSSRSQTVLRRLQKSLTLSIHLRLRGLTLSSKHSKLPFPRELPTPQIHSLKVDSGCSSQSGEKKNLPRTVAAYTMLTCSWSSAGNILMQISGPPPMLYFCKWSSFFFFVERTDKDVSSLQAYRRACPSITSRLLALTKQKKYPKIEKTILLMKSKRKGFGKMSFQGSF